MADKRVNTLDDQATRLADLLIPVDKASGFTEVKKISSNILAPIITELSSKASLTITEKTTYKMRVNDGAGNEYGIIISNLLKGESFITPTLDSNYSQLSGNNLKYRKTSLNEVEIKGGITAVVTDVITTPFTLPSGYRPAETRTGTVKRYNQTGNTRTALIQSIKIKTDGTFEIDADNFFTGYDYFFDIKFTLD